MSPRIVAIIQARMGSSRLPGKVLLEIARKPMLAHVVTRTRRAVTINEVIVATTIEYLDDPIAAFCKAQDIPHTRGSLYDVLDRYYQASRQFHADVIVRITADCPVIDSVVIDATVNLLSGNSVTGDRESSPMYPTANHISPNAFDFTCNRLPPPWGRTYPIGLDTEVCTFAALERAWKEATKAHQREHVMPYFYEGVQLSAVNGQLSKGISPRGFRVALLNHMPDYGALRWTVDTPEDLEFIRQVFARFTSRDDFTWLDMLDLVQREPALAAINSSVKHKGLFEIDERQKE